MNNSNKQSKASLLRQQAEDILKKKSLKTGSPLSEIETLKLIHELEVHQIELEMQNDELVLANSMAQEAAEKYSELYDFAPSVFFTLSQEGKIIELNLSGAKMLGKERFYLKNSQFGFFVSKDTKPIFNLFLEKVFSSQVKESCEVILSFNDNLPLHVQLTGIVTKNGEQCLLTVIEITKLRQTEEELIIANKELVFQNEENEKRTAELTRSKQILDETGRLGRVGGWEMDLKKNELIWSDIVYQIHDAEPDYKPTVESAINFYSHESIPIISKAVSQAINEGKSFDLDLQLITAKQKRIWVRSIGQAYRVNGEIVKIGGMFQDINEKKQAEQELIIVNKELVFQNKEKEKRTVELIKAKEKAEESDRLKTAFLYNISHEIRTPFNGILGFLSILQDYELPESERDEYIGIINQSADRLMNTINEIVEISQIQSGQMQVTAEEINIKMLTGELVDQFKSFVESKRLEFNINNELPDNLTVIFTDGIKLKAILFNLIGNAFKFTKAGSIELKIRQKGDYLEFSIKDSGIGFHENKIKIIFERFMQADVSQSREHEGIGLGLSIATAYVKMLGGKIWAKGEEGKGSTFFFTIKCNIKPE
jgi:signal transduction histidine kinase